VLTSSDTFAVECII